ncbi:MAG: sensor histidine kinase, partial [Acidimicrobiales bacterium]
GREPAHLERVRAAVQTAADGRRVAVASEEEPTRRTIAAVTVVLLVASLVTAATASALAWLVTGRALAPVVRIRRDLDAVVEANGRSRVTEPATGDEVAALATALNDVLGRLEDQSTARRRFVADASHELKSPVANARALIETGQPSAELDDRVLSELDRLQSLVDDLLYLAGSDEGGPERPAILVDLDDLAFDEAERVTARTSRRIDASGVQPALVLGDRSDLARAVRNLVENAARHATNRVEIAIEDRGDRWVLSVSDDGTGIPPEERDRIFERFTRLAGDRSRVDGGTGLGLSIVAAVAEHHGGDVAAVDPSSADEGSLTAGARLELSLPKPGTEQTQPGSSTYASTSGSTSGSMPGGSQP